MKKAELIQKAVEYLVEEGTKNTSSGNWVIEAEEVAEALNVSRDTILEYGDEIADELVLCEPVSGVSYTSEEGNFDMDFFLDYCENAKEEDTIRALLILPEKPPRRIDLDNTLKALQKAVGGYVESLAVEPDVTFLLNEDGKLRGLPANRHYRGDILVGPVVICGVRGERFCSLREDQMAKYERMFQEPETFTPREQVGLMFYTL